jgi:hypothetical protein
MTARNVLARLEKLEARRHPPDESLILWVEPGGNIDDVVASAKADGLFVAGDRVVCAEWLSGDHPPAPAWKRCPKDLTDIELDYFIETLKRRFIGSLRTEKHYPEGLEHALVRNMSDEKLWHIVCGVQTSTITATPEQRDAAVAAYMRVINDPV